MPSSFLTMRYFLPASSALRTNVSVSRFVGAVVHPTIFEGCLLVPSFSAIVALSAKEIVRPARQATIYTFNFTLSATPALNWRVLPLKERPTAQTGLPAAR